MIVYGALMLVGGLVGYMVVRSSGSLIAGVSSGVILGATTYGSQKNPRLGFGIGAAVAAALVVVFIIRIRECLAKTPPTSIGSNVGLCVLSAIVCVYLLSAANKARP